MRTGFSLIFLFLTLVIYRLFLPVLWDNREQVRAEIPAGYIIPSKFSRVLAMGHQELLSDFLFLKVATFIGGRSVAGRQITDVEWDFVHKSLDVVTDLDPYFVDPYLLAEGFLAWDAGKPGLANQILFKGAQYRDWDWRLPFFIGFNEFYFLKNYDNASGHIMQAAELSGSPAYLKTLGARLAYYGGKSQTALLFLKEMLTETDDPLLTRRLEIRMVALERAAFIESALDRFTKQEGHMPKQLIDLVSFGYLLEFPVDPYGGKWVILENGRIFSTSKFTNQQSSDTKEEDASEIK
jgi:hypothetical protein